MNSPRPPLHSEQARPGERLSLDSHWTDRPPLVRREAKDWWLGSSRQRRVSGVCRPEWGRPPNRCLSLEGCLGPVGSGTLLTASFIQYPPGRWRGCNAGSQGSRGTFKTTRLSLIVPDPREPVANCAPWPAGMSLLWPVHREQGGVNVYVSRSRVPREAEP
ncbi:uncharacterized protein [Desmodus rotundus]|uniref:uncharacterized protein n=1 Tax=Desmodus rotundus TaxID=9430 RepID=UPI002380F049|nr:uncharacterized protein LOC112320943 [Desmodus rotundus]